MDTQPFQGYVPVMFTVYLRIALLQIIILFIHPEQGEFSFCLDVIITVIKYV